jgi:hypothetical protein
MNLLPGRLFHRLVVHGAAAITGTGLLPARAAAKPRALAPIGDRYHNPDYIRVSLDRVFQNQNIAIDYAALSAAMLKPYQLILRAGRIWPGGYCGPDAYA